MTRSGGHVRLVDEASDLLVYRCPKCEREVGSPMPMGLRCVECGVRLRLYQARSTVEGKFASGVPESAAAPVEAQPTLWPLESKGAQA